MFLLYFPLLLDCTNCMFVVCACMCACVYVWVQFGSYISFSFYYTTYFIARKTHFYIFSISFKNKNSVYWFSHVRCITITFKPSYAFSLLEKILTLNSRLILTCLDISPFNFGFYLTMPTTFVHKKNDKCLVCVLILIHWWNQTANILYRCKIGLVGSFHLRPLLKAGLWHFEQADNLAQLQTYILYIFTQHLFKGETSYGRR